MANKETPYDNEVLHTALKKIKSIDSLSMEVREVLYRAIKNCKALGEYKVESTEIFYVLKNSKTFTGEETVRLVNDYRFTSESKKKQLAINKSNKDRYKSACKAVSAALTVLVEAGTPLKQDMRRVVAKAAKTRFNVEQKDELKAMIDSDCTITDMMNYINSLI